MRHGFEDGVPRTMVSDDELMGEKRSPWVSLREALDQDQVDQLTSYNALNVFAVTPTVPPSVIEFH